MPKDSDKYNNTRTIAVISKKQWSNLQYDAFLELSYLQAFPHLNILI